MMTNDNHQSPETDLERLNVPEFTVGELSQILKTKIEDDFSHIRLRGEISGLKQAASGHVYFTIKDEDALLDAVCWRKTAERLSIVPEDGMDIIAIGRITTYAARSKYQMVVTSLEFAGEGALLKLLEDRRRRLASEGLFAEDRKQELPEFPSIIGVISSPSGAVIRDILHRLQDRFPIPVILWPVLVQGDGAVEQIAEAISGFDALDRTGNVPRPDLIIVARGGGSLEDLMAFNEEAVVRAAASCSIPLISAVGHETDWTLIDYVSDLRAPTPTAAAEFAVPVRLDLLAHLAARRQRLDAVLGAKLAMMRQLLTSAARGLTNPQTLIEANAQRLDDWTERLNNSLNRGQQIRQKNVRQLGGRLRPPTARVALARQGLHDWDERLVASLKGFYRLRAHLIEQLVHRFRPPTIKIAHAGENSDDLGLRLTRALSRLTTQRTGRLGQASALLESYSYERVLERGFAIIRDKADKPIFSTRAMPLGDDVSVQMKDGKATVKVIHKEGAQRLQAPSKKRQKGNKNDPNQGQLF